MAKKSTKKSTKPIKKSSKKKPKNSTKKNTKKSKTSKTKTTKSKKLTSKNTSKKSKPDPNKTKSKKSTKPIKKSKITKSTKISEKIPEHIDIEPIIVETKKPIHKDNSKILSIVGLLANMFVWPGLGTAIAGDHHKGALQMLCTPSIIMIVLIILSYTQSPLSMIVGGILFFFVWIWGIVSSFHQIAYAFQ